VVDHLCIREVPEGEAEYRYYLNAYNAPRKRENRAMGLLAAFGAALVIGAIMLGGAGL
jgi:hypothetical protein